MAIRSLLGHRDDYDRYLSAVQPGLYESHYLKANSPDDSEAFWIKHNLLVPPGGGGVAELWLVWFRRDESPRVWKREVPVANLTVGRRDLLLRGDHVELTPARCLGRIGNASWQFELSGGLPPLYHLASPLLYRAAFPRKKLMTPVPNLRFDGRITLGDRQVAVAGWIGLRGHNWGSEHAHSYAYGSVNRWDDHAPERTIDAFTARVKVGGRPTPWLSSLVWWDHQVCVEKNRLRHWLNRDAVVEPRYWRLPYRDVELVMEGDPGQYAGLRYRHPDGRESYCYNTKLARVTVTTARGTFTSHAGEHEVLYPDPLPDVPLHPSPPWTQADGDYQSS